MNDKGIQEVLTSSREATNSLLKKFEALKKKLMEDRQKIIKELEKRGLLSDILSYLKEEANKGDQVSLNVFNFWKHGRLPE